MSSPWKKINEEIAFKGWRQIIQKVFEMPDGREEVFDVIGNKPFVTIAAYTTDQQFILVNQYRPGPERNLWSFPEGYIDAGESPEEAGYRELLEETGYDAAEVVLLGERQSAYSTERQHLLIANHCQLKQKQQLDTNEFIDIQLFDVSTLRKFMRHPKGEIFTNIGCAYLAMDYLGIL